LRLGDPALAGFGHAPAPDPVRPRYPVPRSVQAFAASNRDALQLPGTSEQRSFWAYHTRVSSADVGVVFDQHVPT
jgi:hypothetical protein